MSERKLRTFMNDKMKYYSQRFEGYEPMSCLNDYDINNTLIFENDILYKENKGYFVIKKGSYNYRNYNLRGWYIEFYDSPGNKKTINPFYKELLENSKIIGNTKENKKLYNKIKNGGDINHTFG